MGWGWLSLELAEAARGGMSSNWGVLGRYICVVWDRGTYSQPEDTLLAARRGLNLRRGSSGGKRQSGSGSGRVNHVRCTFSHHSFSWSRNVS